MCDRYLDDITPRGSPPSIYLFDKDDCSGNTLTLTPKNSGSRLEISDLSNTNVGNDEISSVAIPPMYYLRLYKDKDFQGDHMLIDFNKPEAGKLNEHPFVDVSPGSMSDGVSGYVRRNRASSLQAGWASSHAGTSDRWGHWRFRCCIGKNPPEMCGDYWKEDGAPCKNFMKDYCKDKMDDDRCRSYIRQHKRPDYDQMVFDYCSDKPYNPDGDFCSCVNSPILQGDSSFPVHCVDQACQKSGYIYTNLDGVDCNIVDIDCNQIINAAETTNATLLNTEQVQNCFAQVNGDGGNGGNGGPINGGNGDNGDVGNGDTKKESKFPIMVIVMIFIFIVVIASIAYYTMFMRPGIERDLI